MSFAVTRAYMRGRLLFIMTGFLIAVSIGAGFIHWQAGQARTNVKFGAVLGAMSEATADVIYFALTLDQAMLKQELAARGGGQQRFDAKMATDIARNRLHEAINRLEHAYHAFGLPAHGDGPMS